MTEENAAIKANEVEAMEAPKVAPGVKTIKLDEKDANRLRQSSMILTQAQQQWQQAQNMILGDYLKDIPPSQRVEIQSINFTQGVVQIKIL